MGHPWIDLTGQVAAVTGAASGIGKAACIALAGAGAQVIALDRDIAGAKAVALAVNGAAHALDVTSEAEWRVVEAWIAREWGHLDILVNSAGVAMTDRVGDASLDVFRQTFAVNVEGSLLGMRIALGFMREAGRGAIINISSTASLKGNPIMASYGASKAAVAHFTRSAALENVRAGHDIRINSVHPGLIETAMASATYQIFDKLGSPDDVVAAITTGRAGQPEEVADLVLFLASSRASYISGAAITIDRAHSA